MIGILFRICEGVGASAERVRADVCTCKGVERRRRRMQSPVHVPHDMNVDQEAAACVKQWASLMQRLYAALPPFGVLAVDRPKDGDAVSHWTLFKKVFEQMKRDNTTDTVLVNGGGKLQYRFRGERKAEPVEVVAVPSHDSVFFLSIGGRVAATGARSDELVRLLNR